MDGNKEQKSDGSPSVASLIPSGCKPKEKEMISGCCVCSEENGWTDNPLIYCDGPNCDVAVHQGCYGIIDVPEAEWFCSKCTYALRLLYALDKEKIPSWLVNADPSTEQLLNDPKCELCPYSTGALKQTHDKKWSHVICALYIPEVRFGNVHSMEPVILKDVPFDRYSRPCYLCDDYGNKNSRDVGACMPCNKSGCKKTFHVSCAQKFGLLCEEGGQSKNVKYCGYCRSHIKKAKLDPNIKVIPAFKWGESPFTVNRDSPASNENGYLDITPSTTPVHKEKKSLHFGNENSSDSSNFDHMHKLKYSSQQFPTTSSTSGFCTKNDMTVGSKKIVKNHFNTSFSNDSHSHHKVSTGSLKDYESYNLPKTVKSYDTGKKESQIVVEDRRRQQSDDEYIVERYNKNTLTNISSNSISKANNLGSSNSVHNYVPSTTPTETSSSASSPKDSIIHLPSNIELTHKKNNSIIPNSVYISPNVTPTQKELTVVTSNLEKCISKVGFNGSSLKLPTSALSSPSSASINSDYDTKNQLIIDGTLYPSCDSEPSPVSYSYQGQTKAALKRRNYDTVFTSGSSDEKKLKIDKNEHLSVRLNSSAISPLINSNGVKLSRKSKIYKNGSLMNTTMSVTSSSSSSYNGLNNSSKNEKESVEELEDLCKHVVEDTVSEIYRETIEKRKAAAAAAVMNTGIDLKRQSSATTSPVPQPGNNSDYNGREVKAEFNFPRERSNSIKRNSISLTNSSSCLPMSTEDKIEASITATISNNMVHESHSSANSIVTSTTSTNQSTSTLEDLLEKQFNRGHTFLLSKAPCDVSQLLTLLQELQKENENMSQKETQLQKRLEHLTTVNNRLKMTLQQPQVSKVTVSTNTISLEKKEESRRTSTPQSNTHNPSTSNSIQPLVRSGTPVIITNSSSPSTNQQVAIQNPDQLQLSNNGTSSSSVLSPVLSPVPGTPSSTPLSGQAQQQTYTNSSTPVQQQATNLLSNQNCSSSTSNIVNTAMTPKTSSSITSSLNLPNNTTLSLVTSSSTPSSNFSTTTISTNDELHSQIKNAALNRVIPPVATRPESRTLSNNLQNNNPLSSFNNRNSVSNVETSISNPLQQLNSNTINSSAQQSLTNLKIAQDIARAAAMATTSLSNNNVTNNLNNTLSGTGFSKPSSTDNSPRASSTAPFSAAVTPVSNVNLQGLSTNLQSQFLMSRGSATGTPSLPNTINQLNSINQIDSQMRDLFAAAHLAQLERNNQLQSIPQVQVSSSSQAFSEQQASLLAQLMLANQLENSAGLQSQLTNILRSQQQFQVNQLMQGYLPQNSVNMNSPNLGQSVFPTGTPPPSVSLNTSMMSSALAK
ncbi:Zinc finger, PHD-type domain and Zinc finger, FYVE/PHD-type domain and Zinc finger, RING/FYVE/PHD-type domain and Zinc finger, PHD-finger domain-containing protein [Strongyloides ratti]|uniref:Zinc finger, PHD-type domain and Zinc finger, FYVE/PHD-type domain and Zinc finger, RING/FYVE/PHD-type domain and Zinc finger, PHD-finger domain-containing protein n=1 Tax=Strongyloides ratti TaxID=34506 RepID=A0A090LBZ9_STRRB|nr:Zinc finger, PHD-type domain and Zinc finger, FYVE/PHD-type domain and Zinc finger, RING/FYVE/PHD-type domain and Zinc finger, PHD-finger domain-containing protein [Strongyloides ratti]CEF67311.1 Zinc finger, PHD-type domain and Zinc finger, FYVE/PHD-type domain and Zinc finger, RING/FYVE/PHD-type domain and Zinc finger, PHD-finger domain-containing protein [Strongyloides ratti]